MAFQISAHGSREGVLRHVKAAKPTTPNADATQTEAVKALIVSEINALPAEYNGVRVEASGDSNPTMRTMSIQIVPAKMHL